MMDTRSSPNDRALCVGVSFHTYRFRDGIFLPGRRNRSLHLTPSRTRRRRPLSWQTAKSYVVSPLTLRPRPISCARAAFARRVLRVLCFLFVRCCLAAGVGGGLDFSALDTAVVLSIATAALALPRYWTPTALLRITARSPVRTLRAATSVQVRVDGAERVCGFGRATLLGLLRGERVPHHSFFPAAACRVDDAPDLRHRPHPSVLRGGVAAISAFDFHGPLAAGFCAVLRAGSAHPTTCLFA